MISDQTIVSARAEKQKALGSRVFRRICTASMAAVLTLPSMAAWALDGPRETPKSRNAFETIALPPIPYLDTMPWFEWNAGVNTLKVDTLLSPILDPSGIKLTPDGRDKGRPAIS
ncbi:hypothetical protein [Bradyrhizobium sp. OAE829]|uniref:hypothetical protein n=1 Tax=Bradyrhizobium sp. OAE829 TaxID=2663807 RepID=UPI001789092D